jgi:hypothetical protein
MRAKLRDIAEAAAFDPKKALLDSLQGRHMGIEMFHGNVLVATYIEPDRTLAENRFQGKGALVLRLGPLAFKDDNIAKFGGVTLKEGDWVMVRPSDGLELFAVDASGGAGTSCRVFEDVNIIARLSDPALVY